MEMKHAVRKVVDTEFLNSNMTIEQRYVVIDVLEEGSPSVVNNLLEMKNRIGAVQFYRIESALVKIFLKNREEN